MPSSDSDLPVSSTDIASPQAPGDKPTGEWAEISTYDAPQPAPVEPGASTDPLAATDPATSPAPSIPDARYIQHYELIRELGRGGMGVVHLARDLRLGRLVAIKILTKPGHQQERFLAEARATARCRHENIVVIHDVGIHGEQPYLVFEYLRGQTLREWMETRTGGAFDMEDTSGSSGQIPGPLAPARAVEMFVPVVRALACAHDMGIIHRDLKPANILLTEDGHTKVLDFGVAKIGAVREDLPGEDTTGSHESLALTALGARLGTLPYMSPEQLAGEAVDHRSDIWAVGIILYELVTGAHPLAPLSMAKIHLMAELDTPMPGVREHRSDLGPLADIISRCLLKDREHRTATAREVLQELEALLPAQRTRARDEDRNPFAGLAAFQESDADCFFGRDHEVTSLVGKLRSLPLVAVTGPSGAGKSSLVRAGVIPALKRSGEGWEALITRPGRQPLAALADVLLAMSVPSSEMPTGRGITRGADQVPEKRDATIVRLRREPGYLGITLRTWARDKLRRILIFIDQFEELWTLGIPSDERAGFLACLAAAADDVASPLRVIVAMRSDFLDRLAEERPLNTEITRGIVLLPPMEREGLRESLLRPVDACEFRFESTTLVDRMVNSFDTTPGALPLLQFTAARLWELRDTERRLLTEASYEQLGGVGGALATHAEDTLARMPAAPRALVREIFRQLVTADGTRAILTRHELRQMLSSSATDDVIEELIRARLLLASEGETDEARVEVVHEALLSSWPRLVAWQREDAESARLRDQLRAAAPQWVERGRSRGLLWRGDALLEYRVWRSRYRGSLTETEEAFARACVHEEARDRRRRRMALVTAFTVLGLGLVSMFGLNRRATLERDRASAFATESRQRLLDLYHEQGRRALLDDSPMQAFAYLAEVQKNGSDSPSLRFLLARATQALSGQRLVLAGHQGSVLTTRFSPDGTRIATGGEDHMARIWDGRSGALLVTLSGHTDEVWSVRFSPDGARLATASRDGTAKIWDVASGALLWTATHESYVFWADFSHDGARLGTASTDRTARIWDAASGALVRTIAAPDHGLTAATFIPDGTRLITGNSDHAVRIWEVETGALLATIPGHEKPVPYLAVSPDGTRAASASVDTSARIFTLQGDAVTLVDHAKELNGIDFSPDSTRVITASEDRTAKVWDAVTGHLLMTLEGHASGVTFATFSPDGQHILTLSRDGTAKTWDAHTGVLRWTFVEHRDGIWTGDYDPTGASIATASFDGTVRVWAARQTGAQQTLPVQDHPVWDATLAPDATRIATIGENGALRVWNRHDQLLSEIETAHTRPTVTWSSDGTRLLTAGGTTAAVWEVATGTRLLELTGHDRRVRGAAYAPDQARIVTASADRTARIWDARTGDLLVTLQGHADEVTFAAFDPTGRHVVTASRDRTARIWDAATGQLSHTLTGHTQPLTSAHFSVDGTRVITAGEDGKAMIWSDQGAPLVTLDGHEDLLNEAVLSADGQLAFTACQDGKVGFWEAGSGTLLWSIDLHPSAVQSAMFDARSALLLISTDQTAMLWDVAYDHRTAADIQTFADCRIDYTLQTSRLVLKTRLPMGCPNESAR
jgi:WD40 repeat protein/serine/threonine protein kinase